MGSIRTFDHPGPALDWLRAHAPTGLSADHRRLTAGQALLAWPGAHFDPRTQVEAAVRAGAVACLVEAEGVAAFEAAWAADPTVLARVAALPGLKAQAGKLAAALLRPADRAMDVVAITGTNGKTSCSWWVAQALAALNRRSAVIGTLGVGRMGADGPEALMATGLTTPDAVALQTALAAQAREGVQVCAMEASSIGLAEGRLSGTAIRVAAFTNFTQDHLDWHGDMAAYWAAKRRLFDWPGLEAAVIQVDDAQGLSLLQALAQAKTVPTLWAVGLTSGTALARAEALGPAVGRVAADGIRHSADGLRMNCHITPPGVAQPAFHLQIDTGLIGHFNVHNLLVVVGCLLSLGVGAEALPQALARLRPVPGRMARIRQPAGANSAALPAVVVDYAHTPDALAQVLASLRPWADERGGRLWCLFGCGGQRDASKRPLMARAAQSAADAVVLTSDNPRHEDPKVILRDVQAGFAVESPVPVTVIDDRLEAIMHALTQAQAADVVLLAGKGHEITQEVAGELRPFSDEAVARDILAQRAAAAVTTPASAEREAPHARLMTLAQAQAALPQARLVGDPGVLIQRVHTDSRSLQAGDLFVALRGERFDAHAFLAQAREAGAVAAIAERGLAEAGLSGLEVDDSLVALQTLATAWRARASLPVIGVTGSNGKTTVTQMIAGILRAADGERALATQGNFNNHIGVPLTVLRLRPEGTQAHRSAVVELGMNHPGEIATLAAIAQPTVVVVTNAQREHQEFMASVEAVARENGTALEALPADGVAVLPALDAQLPVWLAQAGSRRVWQFAGAAEPHLSEGTATSAALCGADVRALGRWQAAALCWAVSLHTPQGSVETQVHLPGTHNLHNAAAAAAAALAAGIPLAAVAEGLAAFRPVNGRSQALSVRLEGAAVTLVDDSYNANPDSVLAAIDVLQGLPGPRWLVLGDMGEVGDQGPAFHAEVGVRAAERGIEHLWCAGSACEHAALAARAHGLQAHHAATVDELLARLSARGQRPQGVASVLVKGSRFMRMERVVRAIQALEAVEGH